METDDRSRIARVREVAGAIAEVAAVAVLISGAALAATITVGTIHFFYGIW